MTDELKEQEAAEKAITDMVQKQMAENKQKEMAETLQSKTLGDLGFVTKKELEEFGKSQKEEREALKELILRAKAQGKATINEEKQDKHAELKAIYGDFIK